MENPNTPHDAAISCAASVPSAAGPMPQPAPDPVGRLSPEVRKVLTLLSRDHALVLLCDAADRVAWINDRLRILPADAKTYVGSSIHEILPSYVAGGRSDEAVQIESTEGELLHLDIRSFPVQAANNSHAVVARRIADLRGEADRTGGSAALLTGILDRAPEPALASDREGFITFANAAAAEFLEIPLDDLVGRPLLGCTPSRPSLAMMIDGLRGREAVDVETEIPGSEGHSWVAISSRRLRAPTGEVLGNVVFIRDTSEQHRAQNELAAKNEEFEDYVSHVSHDLRSPLVSVLGFAGLLRRDYGSALDADGRRFLDRIEQAGHTMQSMIDSLLEFARVDQVEDRATPTDPSGVIQQVMTDQKRRLDEHDVAVAIPSDLPLLCCDRTHAYQIFSNLVSNALSHMGPVPNPRIEIEIDEQPHYHHIRVRDNGPGVPAKEHERIFELFTTLASRERGTKSTGVGLAIVRKLATRYAGQAWVESPTSGGAEFHVTLSRD